VTAEGLSLSTSLCRDPPGTREQILLCRDINFCQYLGAFSDEIGYLFHVIYQRLCSLYLLTYA